ncbi:MAG: hypothetical protein WD750_01275 [Gammaproteobacteria bacterium]
MNSQILKTLIDAGAVKKVRIIADGGSFRVEVETPNNSAVVHTLKGKLKTWGSLDAAAKWLRSLGIGTCQLDLANWQPGQKGMKF